MGLKERAFVLVPLLEIAPDIKLLTGEYLKDFLKNISEDDLNSVKKEA